MTNRSVIVTTPIPTLEEFGESLGISKTRQKALMQIIMGSDTVRPSSRRGTTMNLMEAKKSGRRVAKRR
jgi:hypothetical protein